MVTIPFCVDKETILNLQRLYDTFIYDTNTGQYLKELSIDFRFLQQSKLKDEVFKLYNELFRASKAEELQYVVLKTNRLMAFLMNRFGDFTHDPEFLKVDTLDKILLFDLIDSITALERQ